MQYARKVFVDIIIRNNKDGIIEPLMIIWGDGREFIIDKTKHICKAASLKVGGCGTRYTIVIEGKERYLFHEDNKWFVEAFSYEKNYS